mmetsp:Transcript_130669/g.326045  ORF Transcript_130669/g.326045 Transcript_130669/m.326045 type:complete len:130 (-) Transcript_130669:32-421(-)
MAGRVGASGWKSLSWTQKMVYSSAVVNGCVVGFVWLKRQFKMADKEAQEMKEMQSYTAEMDVGNWSESSRFRCFFAAQRYHMFGSKGPEDEKEPEVQKMLEVMEQCRQELYRKLPSETPAMRPLHMPPQ